MLNAVIVYGDMLLAHLFFLCRCLFTMGKICHPCTILLENRYTVLFYTNEVAVGVKEEFFRMTKHRHDVHGSIYFLVHSHVARSLVIWECVP